MKFSCEKAILLHAISIASKAVANRSTIPALEGILIETNDVVRLTGYNLETGIQTLLAADIQETGSIVVNARLFNEIIRKLPDDMITIFTENESIQITCNAAKFNILGTNAEDFPLLPSVEQVNSFSIPQKILKAMISQTLFAVSTDDSKPVHMGSLFEVNQESLTLVSVDGYRLALRREKIENIPENIEFSFVVPGSALSEVEKIALDSEDLTIIKQGERHIIFQIGDTMLLSRRLEGEFLNYRQAIVQNHTISVFAKAKDLLTSVDRVSLLINDKLKSPLRCTFEKNQLLIQTSTAIGNASDTCVIEGDGQALEIGFNNRYLLDALKAVPAERVCLKLHTNVSPCLILPENEEDTHFLYMVLPVRLKAGV